MDKNKKINLIKLLNSKYPRTNFYILDRPDDIQLLYDNIELKSNEDFFSDTCDIAINYLNSEEQLCFSILFDYFCEIPKMPRAIEVNEIPSQISVEYNHEEDYYYSNTFPSTFKMCEVPAA